MISQMYFLPILKIDWTYTDKLQLFVGGHENHNFSLLPHDLPVHRGFDGCIFDLSVRSTEAAQASCHAY